MIQMVSPEFSFFLMLFSPRNFNFHFFLYWIDTTLILSIYVVIFTASVANGQFTIKQLTHMMLTGKSNEVMQYIRTLPKEQMHQVRMKLIRNLEAIQQKNKKKKEDVDEGGRQSFAFILNFYSLL